ncbi:MAG: bacteriohemerythrin [Candidatus Eisenbacteria bacterium]
MAYIQWDNSLSVGVKRIDDQHRRLIDMINDLDASVNQVWEEEAVNETLTGLFDYVQEHFRTEENLFDEHGYPEGDAHKKEHKAFVGRLLDFHRRVEDHGKEIAPEMIAFLQDWLLNHIRKIDQKYAPFLAGKGLS